MTKPHRKVQKEATKTEKKNFFSRPLTWVIVIPVIIIAVFHAVPGYQLVNWDDKLYVKETPMVQGLTMEHVKQMFTQKVLLSYNPLVLMSFAIDYEMSRLDPHWSHTVNLIFHILNALLLFACLRKLRFSNEVSGLITLLFAVHPLTTEAVVWVAGRKDMLYGFFYLSAWFFYLQFAEKKKWISYTFALVLFACSLLSKVQAITFPFILLISDYTLKGTISKREVLNKIPFLVMSIAFGIIAVSGSTLVADKYSVVPTFADKIIYSLMGTGLYFIKIIFPFPQSAIYPFPEKSTGEYWLLLITGIIISAALIFIAIKTYRKAKYLAGGIMFFLVSIFVVLHIVAFNSSLIYERFTYLASIGIFIAILNAVQLFPAWYKVREKVIGGVVVIFGVACMMRAGVWKDPESLWTDVIQKAPNEAVGWNNRGMVYLDNKMDDKALEDFNECIKHKPKHPDAYNNRSIIYYNRKDYKDALADNLLLLNIDTAHKEGYSNRGSFFYTMQQYDSAKYYYLKSTQVYKRNASSFFYAGVSDFNMKNYREAIQYLYKAIDIVPNYADAYVFLGMSYARLGLKDSVLYCVNKAESFTPLSAARQSASKEYQLMGSEAFNHGDWQTASRFYNIALEIKPDDADALYYMGGISLSRQDVNKAREYWKKALSINPNHQEAKEWLAKVGG
jgi:tetratricopeptide (TPR) repeat protein